MMISVVRSDITILAVDAVVNAANESMLGGGGVDGAIHRAAGDGLLQACRKTGGCPTGEARITPGFGLRSKWIIHAVGPRWHGGGHDEAGLLRSCYKSALDLAVEYGARSIAVPCISTGIFGYPKRQAAEIALSVMRSYERRFDEIICCCFEAEDRRIYEEMLEE